MSRRLLSNAWVVTGAFGLLAFLLLCGGLGCLVTVPFTLAFGWGRHVWGLVSVYSFDATAAVTIVLGVAGLIVGLFLLSRWMGRGGLSLGRSAAIVGLTLTALTAGICLMAIAHQFAWMTTDPEPPLRSSGGIRQAAAEIQSLHILKQQVLAAVHFADNNKNLLPGGTYDAVGNGLHGWGTFLLPYMEHNALYAKIDLNVPWDHPKNRPATSKELPIYYSPLVHFPETSNFGLSSYAGNGHVLGLRPWSQRDIPSTSETILFGEVGEGFQPWAHPANLRDPSMGLNTPDGFGCLSIRGDVGFAFADGSARRLAGNTSLDVLRALAQAKRGCSR